MYVWNEKKFFSIGSIILPGGLGAEPPAGSGAAPRVLLIMEVIFAQLNKGGVVNFSNYIGSSKAVQKNMITC